MDGNPQKLGFLDNIRLSGGNNGLKSYFQSLTMNDPGKAIALLNDADLGYGTLYVLQGQLERSGLRRRLNARNRTALRITRDIAVRDTYDIDSLTRGRNEDALPVLKWMLGTGYTDDGMSSGYDTVMEHTAILLSRTYRDTEMLGRMEEMIFARHRNGLFLHHLVWAFFEARSPDSLYYIANRLLSAEKSDTELAKRLLCFIPGIDANNEAAGPSLYYGAAGWLQENRPFLYYTGESMHLTGKPRHYDLSREAKYLCSPVSAEDGSYLRAADDYQRSLADAFNKLNDNGKRLLSDYSYFLYRKNVYQWNSWIRLPIDGQIQVAAALMGGRHDE